MHEISTAYKLRGGGVEAPGGRERTDCQNDKRSTQTRGIPIRGLTNFCDRGSKGEAHAASENPTPPVVMPNVRACSCVRRNILKVLTRPTQDRRGEEEY